VGRLVSIFERVPHIWHIREFGDLDFSLRYIFPKFLSTMFLKSSDAIICHAKTVRDHWFKPGTKRVHLVYNGSATRDHFDALLKQRNEVKEHSNFVFAMLSNITPKKGQEMAIRALAELQKIGHSAKLLIAGDGKQDYLDQLKQLVKDLNIADRVKFTGFVDDPYPIYFASDCVLICSEHEALSRVGLEAMSTALPLIGKNSGGAPEIIVQDETGLLYNIFDELVEAMATMVQNPDLGQQMGLEGWRRAKENFNIEDYAANVFQVIQSVVKQPKK
jgi:glycosyltransferase involved in cell wall biosynthesis